MINYRSMAKDTWADACYLVEAMGLVGGMEDMSIDRNGIEKDNFVDGMNDFSFKRAMIDVGKEEFYDLKPWVEESLRRLRGKRAREKLWADAAVPLRIVA